MHRACNCVPRSQGVIHGSTCRAVLGLLLLLPYLERWGAHARLHVDSWHGALPWQAQASQPNDAQCFPWTLEVGFFGISCCGTAFGWGS